MLKCFCRHFDIEYRKNLTPYCQGHGYNETLVLRGGGGGGGLASALRNARVSTFFFEYEHVEHKIVRGRS